MDLIEQSRALMREDGAEAEKVRCFVINSLGALDEICVEDGVPTALAAASCFMIACMESRFSPDLVRHILAEGESALADIGAGETRQ